MDLQWLEKAYAHSGAVETQQDVTEQPKAEEPQKSSKRRGRAK